jgi:chaperonin cofactor prefoldin
MATEAKPPPTQAWIVETYQRLKGELDTLAQRVLEFEAKHREHSVVCETLRPLDGGRRCYQLLGGVLAERTVKEVLPVVEKNSKQYEQVCCAPWCSSPVIISLSNSQLVGALFLTCTNLSQWPGSLGCPRGLELRLVSPNDAVPVPCS